MSGTKIMKNKVKTAFGYFEVVIVTTAIRDRNACNINERVKGRY